MKEKSISTFLNNDYSDAALYMSYRALPSYIDGLKNSGRKIVYTAKKKNLKDLLKVSTYANLVIAESNYLHGDMALQGVVVTSAQKYLGSNNLPVLEASGNFGTRFLPESSSARYIYTRPQPYFYELFRKEDDINLSSQMFEGDEIEPCFYVPTVPLVLINGSTGIGVGFSAKILCRPLDNIITAIRNRLTRKKNTPDLFVPGWEGFKGQVIDLGNNKWDIRGVADIKGKKVHITELPVPYSLMDYLEILKKLKEKGLIDRYLDMSDSTTDTFEFEVTLSLEESQKSKDEIFNDLKLSNTITETLTCIDENNAIREFNSIQEIFDAYYTIKIEYLQKRIQSEIERLSKEASELKEVHNFIEDVIANKINLKNKRAIVEKDIKARGYTIVDRLLAMPLYSITEEKALEAKKKWEQKEEELEKMKKENPVTLWKKDLDALEKKIHG